MARTRRTAVPQVITADTDGRAVAVLYNRTDWYWTGKSGTHIATQTPSREFYRAGSENAVRLWFSLDGRTCRGD